MKTTHISRGFTLIELLVVIGILSILIVGLIVAINPQDKLRQARDARVINDIGAIARASEAYATGNSGIYPSTLAGLSPAEMKTIPAPPSGYGAAYGYVPAPAACGVNCTSVVVTGQLQSNKNVLAGGGTSPVFERFESSTGKTCIVATATTACP